MLRTRLKQASPEPVSEPSPTRREFLGSSLGLALATNAPRPIGAMNDPIKPGVMTVRGWIDPVELGLVLPHEHILVDFVGALAVSRDRYDGNEVLEVARPHLARARGLGLKTLFECTPAYLGRDPALLRRLSEATGVQVVTNTGYYGANDQKHLPRHALEESADQLADRWLIEWRDGIEETGVRPGFLKIGVNRAPLSDIDRKLVRAAARVHKGSGLTIASHTGDGRAALEQLAILEEEHVDPAAFLWVHAQNERDTRLHSRVGRAGAWIEFDGLGPETLDLHLTLVKTLADEGLLDRILLSHDAGWYHVGEPGGGAFRPFDTLFAAFLPRLKTVGFSDEECRGLTVDNPREAFTIRVRG